MYFVMEKLTYCIDKTNNYKKDIKTGDNQASILQHETEVDL